MKDLKNIILRGVMIMLAREGGSKLLGVVGTMIVARILFPADFGCIATMFAVVNLPTMIFSRGISVPVIQCREAEPAVLSGGMALCLVGGALASGLLFLGAPVLARFLGVSRLEVMLQIAAPAILFRCLSALPVALLQKRLRFFRAALPQFVSECFFWCVAVGLCWRGWGAVSYAWALLAASLVGMTASWLLASLRFSDFAFPGRLDFIGRNGFTAVMVEIVEYVTLNMDSVIIVKFLGPVALGFYYIAFKFSNYFYQIIGTALSNVMFPAFSAMDDAARLKKYFLKTTLYLAVLVIPFYVLAMLFSHDLVLWVYGPRWLPSAGLLSVLCVAGIVKGLFLGGVNRDVFYAKGRLDYYLMLKGVVAFSNATGILIGLFYGITGVALGVTVAGLLSAVYVVVGAGRLVGVGWVEYGENLKFSFSAGVVMALGVVVLKQLLPQGGMFTVGISLLGAALYVGVLHCFGIHLWRDARASFEVCFPTSRS